MGDLKKDANKSKMILEAIDALRNRKARPDETRICHWIERRYGLTRDEVMTDIKESIADGKVLKVRYKDSISYRNPAKFNRVALNQGNKSGLPLNVTKRVLRVLRQLSVGKTASVETRGANLSGILTALHSSKQLLSYNETSLERILKRAVQGGSVTRLSNGNYVLSSVKHSLPLTKKRHSSTPTTSASNSSDSVCVDSLSPNDPDFTRNGNRKKVVSQIHLKRVRPISTRRKFKKSLGPDFLEPSDLGLQYLQDTFEPKCDYCQLTAVANRDGDNEELLVCKDCRTKAHPSCLNYSKELATRSRCSPWQCMDCKACFVCEDSGDGENMLFCDLCDKGYHMGCHDPPLTKKPNGKWVCNSCQENKSKDIKEEPKEKASDLATDQRAEPEKELDESNTIFNKICKLNNADLSLPADLLVYPNITTRPQSWTVEDVETFIKFIGYPDQACAFKEQCIDGISLLLLSRMDVLTGLSIKLGPALKIYGHVRRLQYLYSQQE